METINNVKSIEISETTKKFLTIKAELSQVYNHLAKALQDVDPKDENEKSRQLKDALLEADTELLHYIAELMDEQMLMTGFRTL